MDNGFLTAREKRIFLKKEAVCEVFTEYCFPLQYENTLSAINAFLKRGFLAGGQTVISNCCFAGMGAVHFFIDVLFVSWGKWVDEKNLFFIANMYSSTFILQL